MIDKRVAVVGVGSNVMPKDVLPLALREILSEVGTLHVSPIIETEPVGMIDGSGAFLNGVIGFPTDLTVERLKRWLHDLEKRHGRRRDVPGGSWKARPLDLDFLLFFTPNQELALDRLPKEPYVQPCLLDLLGYLSVLKVERESLKGVAMHVDGNVVGLRSTTLFKATTP